MLKLQAIGNIGGQAEVKNSDGREFTSFRIAHNDRWTDTQGNAHDTTQWVDCIINGRSPLLEWLRPGQQVFVDGSLSTRVYSSAKDRCYKAGLTISVQRIELIGGSSDLVPARLYDENGQQVDVSKYFHCPLSGQVLRSQRGQEFVVDDNGWILPMSSAPQEVQDSISSAANPTKSKSKKA